MIARCETCPFWEHDGKTYPWGKCLKATWTDDCMHGELHALVTPHEDRVIYTAKQFGCVLHPANKAIA